MSGSATDALSALLGGRIEQWQGLQPGLAPSDLASLIDAPGEAPAMSDLGMRKALVLFGALVGYDAAAELWVSPADREVWSLAIADPPFAGTPAELRARLGEPELELDSMLGTVPLPQAEWAYPARGITVYADVEDERVWRIALYPAATSAEYGELYRARIGERRLPGSRF